MSNQKYEVIKQFDTLCCNFPRKLGEIIKFYSEWSPKRILIEGEVGIHTIKKSKLISCCKAL